MSVVLSRSSVDQLIDEDPNFTLQWVYEDDTVEKLLVILKDFKISSVPVMPCICQQKVPIGTIDIVR
jgi:hypothetical protein